MRKVLVSLKKIVFVGKAFSRSRGQGVGAEQESGECAVSCPSTDVLCDPQLSTPNIMQEMITSP